MGPVEAGMHDRIIAARGRMGMIQPQPRVATQEMLIQRLRTRVADLEMQVLDLTMTNHKLERLVEMTGRRQKVVTIIGAMPGTPVSRDRWRIIVDQVAAKHNLTANDVRSARRAHEVVVARHECFYRLKNETTMSLPQIGRLMGNKDHTTVLHGIHRHEARIASGEAA